MSNNVYFWQLSYFVELVFIFWSGIKQRLISYQQETYYSANKHPRFQPNLPYPGYSTSAYIPSQQIHEKLDQLKSDNAEMISIAKNFETKNLPNSEIITVTSI